MKRLEHQPFGPDGPGLMAQGLEAIPVPDLKGLREPDGQGVGAASITPPGMLRSPHLFLQLPVQRLKTAAPLLQRLIPQVPAAVLQQVIGHEQSRSLGLQPG